MASSTYENKRLLQPHQSLSQQDKLGELTLQALYQYRSTSQAGAAYNLRLSNQRHLLPQQTLELRALFMTSIDVLSPAHIQSCTLRKHICSCQQTLLPPLLHCSSHTT